MSHLLKRFWHDIGGLLWLFLGLFLGLALLSYHPTDPSFNSTGKGMEVLNYCGILGSFLADILFQVFGVTAALFSIASLRMSLIWFRGKTAQLETWRLGVAFLLVCTTCSLFALYLPQYKIFSGQIHLGGVLGLAIVGSLQSLLNFGGVALILTTLAAILLVFYTEKSMRELFATPLATLKAGYEWMIDNLNWSTRWKALRNGVGGAMALPPLTRSEKKTGAARSSRLFALKTEKEAKNKFMPLPPSEVAQQEEEFEDDQEEDEEHEEQDAEGPAIDGFFSRTALKQNEESRAPRKKKIKTQTRVANWEMPKLSLLADPPLSRTKLDEREIKQKARVLVEKLAQFSVRGEVVGIKPGPAVTMFEFKPAADVKISKITDLADDLSLALSSESVRIIAPIPGRDVVGIETSNSVRESVYAKDLLEHDPFWDEDFKLPLTLGRQADGEPRIVDLRKMPHLLVAGTTGSGKSVFVVSVLTGLLFKHSPKTLRLILVDPKQVDLAAFNDLPHLIMPPVREPKKAVGALRWALREMEKRYRSMSKFGARGIESFNEIAEKFSAVDKEEHETFNEQLDSPSHPESYYYTAQPYIVIVVEEFGDLMAVDKINVEQAVVRLAQMARACGIHLMLAMQSPRKDVVTGLIKTNIPGRISFKVASKMDSRIILDESGAERLLARGDMLFLAPGVAKPQRHHGPFLSEEEISEVVNWWKRQGEPEYDRLALRALEGPSGGGEAGASDAEGDSGWEDDLEKDTKYDEILAYVASQKEVSASLIQRKFRLGYPRAARMIEKFEHEGIVGPANGSKPRQVLVRDLREL